MVEFSANVILFNEVGRVSHRDTPELQIYACSCLTRPIR